MFPLGRWPTGLVQVLLFIFVFYQVKLYSDLILHVVYVGMQIYGWWFCLSMVGNTGRHTRPIVG
jgi:nicotinamide mononucleotide transporter